MIINDQKIISSLEKKRNLRLFLDYDGTLADFSANPNIVEPNQEVITLLESLRDLKHAKIAVISGRKLSHLKKLIPIDRITLAGTYGIEIQLENGTLIHREEYSRIRPTLDSLKPKWQIIIKNTIGIHLEDKGWALALHGRFVEDNEVKRIFAEAEQEIEKSIHDDRFQILTGHKFLEICPSLADKGRCVNFLLKTIPSIDETIIYLGDDDKDEQAFKVIKAQGGFAIRISSNTIHNPIEDYRLDNPQAARKWLYGLTEGFSS